MMRSERSRYSTTLVCLCSTWLRNSADGQVTRCRILEGFAPHRNPSGLLGAPAPTALRHPAKVPAHLPRRARSSDRLDAEAFRSPPITFRIDRAVKALASSFQPVTQL